MISVLLFLAMLGTSFSYFSARITKINETKTQIKTNEFNEDLVYTLMGTDVSGNEISTIILETPLPVTNTDKSYLKENIQINRHTIKYYKIKIEYKYTNASQGKKFVATLGIDSNAL